MKNYKHQSIISPRIETMVIDAGEAGTRPQTTKIDITQGNAQRLYTNQFIGERPYI
jgi:hypothetical protein